MDKRFKNHIGERYGLLTVIERPAGHGDYRWKCQCECGNTTYALINNMKRGVTKSCGCLHQNDLTGKKFGRLTVLKRVEKLSNGHSKWLCICDCGNIRVAFDTNLKKSYEVSCGCVRREKYISEAKYKGASKDDLYKIWASMIKRCYNPKATNYPYYGGRGIRVCDDWIDKKNGYFLFKGWALTHGYEEGLSIERVNYDGDYTPDNCTWIPRKEQMKNTRRTHKLTYKGRTMCLTDWAIELNMNRGTLTDRLARGMTVEEAFETPVKKRS